MDSLRTNSDWQTVTAGLIHQLGIRDDEVETLLKTRDLDGIRRRTKRLRDKLAAKVGLDFERCPLEAEVIDTLPMEGYKIEKVIIQSLPGYYVPVNVYLPLTGGRHPAILVSMGHYIEGKHVAENQIMCANLALKGFVAATFDPICQGERDMYPDRKEQWYKDDIWMVEEHMRVGHQSYALGESSAKYFIWDGMRVIDYLCSRMDVDSERIGCTGQSGGGTATYYLAALDERVKAAVPIQCLTKQAMILEKNGIGDPEQTIFALWDEFVFDHPDFLWLAFPKPVMVVAGLYDYFYIEGVREIGRELSELYRLMGNEEAFRVAEVDSKHYISRDVRINCYNWFKKWLMGNDGLGGSEIDTSEADVKIIPQQQLYCLNGSKESLTAMDINRQRLQAVRKGITRPEEITSVSENIKQIMKVNKVPHRIELRSGKNETGFTLISENGYTTSCALHKGIPGKPLLAFVDFNSLFDRADVLKIFKGCSILFITPFGMTATSSKKEFCYDVETAISYGNFFTGGSLFARRVEGLLSAINEVIGLTGSKTLHAVCGSGQGAHLAMAAALFDERIQNVLAFEGISSLDAIFNGKDFFIPESSIIPGLAGRYDTADIMAALGRRMAAFINPVDAFLQPVSASDLKNEYDNLAAGSGGGCKVSNIPSEDYMDYVGNNMVNI